MIRKAKFSNFYSFYKEQEINFLAKKKKTYDYYQSKSGDQVTKIAGFIGGNASGKTNVMRFFSFLRYFVCRTISDETSIIPDIAYRTFFNNNEPSSFYIEFENEGSVFFYNFLITQAKILKESLYIKKIKKGSRKIEIFSRQAKNIEKLNSDYFVNLSKKSFPKIREDVSFITFIKKSTYSVDIINSVYDYFSKFKTNINEKGQRNPLVYQVSALVNYLKDRVLKQKVENFISYFDVGLKGFEIKENKEEEKKVSSISVLGIHSCKEKNNKLDFGYESSGTQSLFFTMANILMALKNNNVVIVDEMESGFHPEALNKLIGYFIDEDKDKNAQLIFSSHSLGFMSKLDMHQIFLVEKKGSGESGVDRLNQVKGIRPDENFQAKYMTGSYGAFPKIRV